MGQLDDNKADIVHAIDSLNRLAVSVRKQQGSIDAALERAAQRARSIDSQRDDLVKMLQALDHLSGVGVRVIKASKASTIETLPPAPARCSPSSRTPATTSPRRSTSS